MKKKVQTQEKKVYKSTTPAFMKFIPTKDFDIPVQTSKANFMTGVKQFFSNIVPNRLSKTQQQINKNQIPIQKSTISNAKKQVNRLKYVKRLTNDEFLIGNEDQLDAIQVSGIIDGFVNTQYLWSIKLNRAILHVQIDTRKNYIIVLPIGEVLVFKFKPKFIEEVPTALCSIKLIENVKFIQVVKQSHFALCYPKGIEVYAINQQAKSIVSILKKPYDIKNPNLKLFQIPQPCENILNIFFQECSQKDSFSIWIIEVEFLYSSINMSKITKIYDLPIEMKKIVILQNYSKQIYFINLGEKIIAIKKGYFIDSARVDKKTDDSHLKYFPHSKLLHISTQKLQIYKFILNANIIPAKIYLQSNDSIQIPFSDKTYQYLDAIQLNGDNYAVFYQMKGKNNKFANGEIKYAFVLTQMIKLEEKINNIFPESVKDTNIERIEVKADMATKMGLQRKNIYLKLWNNSSKSTVEDYQLLLDTLDYELIKMQIQKKLKKNSMSLRQIILIQQGCLSMLSSKVFKQDNTKEHIKNYMISHLLIRKLEFYKQITMIDKSCGKKISEDEQGKLLINIQNYNYYKTFDIKSMLIELISQFCNQDKDQIQKIRTQWKTFRFSLKTIYLDILTAVIEITKKKFIKILEQIPEILPYNDESLQQKGILLEGIWSNITQEQWQRCLYIDNILTIQNRQNVEQLCQSVWFKRYWLNQHDYVHLTRSQIQQIQDKTCFDVSFYHTIDKVFQIVKDQTALHTIIDFIQDKYIQLPNHILGKIFLYYKLYGLFKGNQKEIIIEDKKIRKFSEFLNLKDPQMFKAMFNYEKLQKGFILKDMKRIYTQLSSSETFPQGLLNYFISPLSKISDIKYLLNRINNQKKQFHEKYQEIYQVLVRGIQLKLKLGEDNDIPADEVLIYIQNIPLSTQNPLIRDLQVMKAINRESSRFKRLKINMSIFQITKNPDLVLNAVISRQVEHSEIMKADNLQLIRQMSYKIIEDVEALKNNLYEYSQQQNDVVAFIYLTKLLQEESMIDTVGKLFQDRIFKKYNLNEGKIQNIVLFMYKWKLNLNSSYVQSSQYLKKLIQLLPEKNSCRMYIQAQVQIALMLSTPLNPINYPLNNGQKYFSSIELQRIILKIDKSYLSKIEIDKLYEYVCTLQRISTDRQQVQITKKALYEMVVLKMLDCNLLIQVFPKIRQLMEMEGEQIGYKFIYPCHIISKIVPQLIEENKVILLQCASYLFKKPLQLLNILEQLINLVCTTSEQRKYLSRVLAQSKNSNLTYITDNPILQSLYFSQAQSSQQQQNLMSIQKNHIKFITKIKQEYSQPYFYNSYIILCNDPYVLPAYIYSIRYQINFKHFRSFFTFITKEEIFNKRNTIEFAKRVFIIIYQTLKTSESIQKIIELFKKVPLQDNKLFEKAIGKNSIERIVIESIETMKNKGRILANQIEKKNAKGQLQSIENKKNRIKQRLNTSALQFNANEYLTIDSDDNNAKSNIKVQKNACAFLVQNLLPQFDSAFERFILINRNGKSLRTYLSCQLQSDYRAEYIKQQQRRNNIFKDLSIDKNKQILQDGKVQSLNDVIRNYIRRSRSQNNENKESKGFSAIKSNVFLSAIASTPHNQQQLLANSNLLPQPRENAQNLENIVLYSRPSGGEFKVQLFEPKQNKPKQEQVERLQVIKENQPLRQEVQEQHNHNEYIVEDVIQFQPQVQQMPTQQIQQIAKEQPALRQIISKDKEEGSSEKQIVASNLLKQESVLKQFLFQADSNINQPLQPNLLMPKPINLTIQQQFIQQNRNISTIKGEKQQLLAIPELGNTEIQIELINSFLNGQKVINSQTIFNFQVLKPYSSHEKFNNFIEEILSALYQMDMTMDAIILTIKALHEVFPILYINKQFLQIYDRAEKLQSKFNLDLPLKLLLGPEGLFIKSQTSDSLFKYLLPRIIDNLNEEQLLKACKVVTLSFKKSQLEQEIMFKYLLTLFYKYEYDYSNPLAHQREKDMLREKIEVILGKISVKLLKKKEEQIVEAVTDAQIRIQIIKMIISSCRNRSDSKVADYFESKYLVKLETK